MNSVNNGHACDGDGDSVHMVVNRDSTAGRQADSPGSSSTINHDAVELRIDEIGGNQYKRDKGSVSSQDILLPGSVLDDQNTMADESREITSFTNPAITEDVAIPQKPSIRMEDLFRDQDLLDLTIHQIAKEGDVDLLEKKFSHSHLVRPGQIKKRLLTKDADKLTPLHYAVRYNNLDMCTFLIGKGAESPPVADSLITYTGFVIASVLAVLWSVARPFCGSYFQTLCTKS